MTKVLWFTGLSGSGKSTVTELLKEEFKKLRKSYAVFDGDDVREKLHKHLGFSREDIFENNRLITELCKKEFGKIDYILVPIISPFKKSREFARKIFGKDFVEVYFDCPYEECKKRDVKGLYKKAEEGKIENFIGKDVSYEIPEKPEIKINSVIESSKESAEKIINFLF